MNILPRCFKPWSGFEVDDSLENWGGIRPCCWGLKYAGNVNEGDLEHVWNNEIFQEYRIRMLEGNTAEICPSHCPILNSTHGDRDSYMGIIWRRPQKNHLRNFLEIIQQHTTLQSYPITIKISPTLSCNIRCIMCYQSHNNQLEFSPKTISDLLQLSSRAQLLQVQGGEIFAAKTGIEFLDHVARMKDSPPIGIITNGSFPIKSSWDLLARLKIKWIMVSIDAANPETYGRIRIGGNWNIVLENIHRLTSLRTTLGFRLILSFTVMSLNYQEILDIIKLAHKFGCDVCFNLLTTSPDTQHQGLAVASDPATKALLSKILANAFVEADRLKMSMARSTIRSFQNIYL